MTTIDAHHHFWTIGHEAYSWIRPEMGVLYGDWGPAELEPELRSAGVDASVVVQAANHPGDTELMLAAADEHAWVAAVVGWVPIAEPPEAERALDRLARHPKLRGIRHLVQAEPDPDWLTRPEVLSGLRLLSDRGLVFEIPAQFPRHLEHVPALAERLPELRVVIDHLAKPPIGRDGFEGWVAQISAAAESPNVYAKLSGLGAAGDHQQRSASEVAPYVDVALGCFGAERLMYGSDWPVCLLKADYPTVWREIRSALGDRKEDEIAAIYGGTAARVYSI